MWSSREWNGRVSESNQSLGSPHVPHESIPAPRRSAVRSLGKRRVSFDPVSGSDDLACANRARLADRDVDLNVGLSRGIAAGPQTAKGVVKCCGIPSERLPFIPAAKHLDGIIATELDTSRNSPLRVVVARFRNRRFKIVNASAPPRYRLDYERAVTRWAGPSLLRTSSRIFWATAWLALL
jgi:hypothetical protein